MTFVTLRTCAESIEMPDKFNNCAPLKSRSERGKVREEDPDRSLIRSKGHSGTLKYGSAGLHLDSVDTGFFLMT